MTFNRSEETSLCLTVRPNETDPYSITHHSNYFIWAELGLLKLLEAQADANDGKRIPYRIKAASCKYMTSAVLGDDVWVYIHAKKSGESPEGTATDFVFRMQDQTGRKRFAAGELSVVFQ